MTTTGIHAPIRNFETMTTTSTTNVAIAPTALTARPTRHRGSRSCQCRTTIPLWDRVNPVNTPTAYSGTRADTSASYATISRPAMTDRVTMPLENTSRSPRFVS